MDVFIQELGAVPDGKTKNTTMIQKAIDQCHASGGGKVIISGGIYMTGTIILKSNVNLHIAADGVLLGSPDCGKYTATNDVCQNGNHSDVTEDYGDYPDFEKVHVDRSLLPRHRGTSLIFAEEADNISITGNGTIDANGMTFIEKVPDGVDYWMPYRRIDAPTPPRVVFLTGCSNVLIEDIRMINQPAGWSYWIHDCDYVNVDRIKICADVQYPNNDGVHINSSRNVTVSNSCITCGDDCIIVRANNISLKENKVCERVTVTNCNLTSHSSGIRIAWVNDGTIRNCVFSNLVMTDTTVGVSILIPHKKGVPSDFGREKTLIENLSFSNIVMDCGYSYPIYISLPEDDHDVWIDAIRNLYFSNIHYRGLRLPCLMGREENSLNNIQFSDCSFEIQRPDGNEKDVYHGAVCGKRPEVPSLIMKNVSSYTMNNTRFTVI